MEDTIKINEWTCIAAEGEHASAKRQGSQYHVWTGTDHNKGIKAMSHAEAVQMRDALTKVLATHPKS